MEACACSAEICKVNSNIVQLRLDFTSFVLSNLTSGVATSFALLNGAPQPTAAILLTDNVMKIPGSVGSPEICEVNTDDHCKTFCVSILAIICGIGLNWLC